VHVRVDLTAGADPVSLAEPADCARFDVVVHGAGDDEDLDRALVGASVGQMDGSEALVNVTAVRRLASGSVPDGWEKDFLAMVDFARGRGWLTEDGHAIRAHVAWQ
jgi:hypothetical protein